jgi:HEPN domain-containing protein
MLTVKELRKIARTRLREAEALYQAKQYDGATYLCGYAIEAALKARICKTLNWEGYPSTKKQFQDYLIEVIMRRLIKKLVTIENEISVEKGDFSLLAFFLQDGAPNRWDLVVAAPWIEKEKKKKSEKEILRYFVDKLKSHFTNETFFGLDIEQAYFITVKQPELTETSAASV